MEDEAKSTVSSTVGATESDAEDRAYGDDGADRADGSNGGAADGRDGEATGRDGGDESESAVAAGEGAITAEEFQPEGPVVAPPWTGKVYYLVGGALPKRYLPWVWNDLRAPGWRRRQAARPVLLMLPFALVFALLPGQMGVRITVVAFVLVASIGLGIATANYFRNRRLVLHGLPPVTVAYNPEDFDE